MKKNLKIYTPDSALKKPLRLFKDIAHDLRSSYDLTVKLALRDISAQYRQTFLGYFWAILPPILTSLVFIILNKSTVINISSSKIPYVAFVFSGTIFWQLFVDSANAPLKFVIQNKSMLTKINFPRESIILAGIIQVLFSLLIKFVLLAGILFYLKIYFDINFASFFLSTISILLFGTLFGMFLVPAGVLYTDIQQALAVVFPALMLLTPVVYAPSDTGLLAKINIYNPLTYLIMSARDSLFFHDSFYYSTCLKIAIFSLFFLFLSFIVYRVSLPHLIERMEA